MGRKTLLLTSNRIAKCAFATVRVPTSTYAERALRHCLPTHDTRHVEAILQITICFLAMRLRFPCYTNEANAPSTVLATYIAFLHLNESYICAWAWPMGS